MVEATLPREAGSSSELLSSTHVFLIEVASTHEKPWVREPSGEEKRGIDLHLSVREVLKGPAPAKENTPVAAEVFQHRSPNPFGEEGPLWSQIQPEAGKSYSIFSEGDGSSSLGTLLNEGACQRILPGAQIAEVHLARSAEHVFQEKKAEAAPPGQDSEVLASRALIAFATSRAPQLSDLFGRYLWARIVPSFLRSPDRPVGELMALLTSSLTPPSLRLELSASLDRVAPDLAGDSHFLAVVARAYFELLLDPKARDLHSRITQIGLYFLIFPEEGAPARVAASALFPDPAERQRYAAALAAIGNDRAAALAAWLQR